MPYEIVERDNQYCVAKADTGEILDGACHDTREDAVNQLQAIEANENKSIMFGGAIKSLGGNRIGGYLIEYTDEDNKDLDGEFFTKDTDQMEEEFPTIGMKVLFHHGLDKTLWVKSIGEIVEAKHDDVGLWVEALLDEHSDYKEYVNAIRELVAKGILAWSSGAFPQSVTVDDNGFIKSWGKYEASVTHTPANPSGTKIQTLKSIASLIEPREADTPIEDSDKQLADLSATVQKINDNVASEKESEMSVQKNPELMEMLRGLVTQITGMIDDYTSGEDKAEIDEEIVEEVAGKIDDEMEDDDLEMTDKAMRKYLDSVIEPILKKKLSKLQAEKDAGIESSKAMVDRLREEKERAAKGISQVGSFSNGNGLQKAPRYEMNNLKFAHLSPSDMALGVQIMGANAKRAGTHVSLGNLVSEDYLKHMAHGMQDYGNGNPYTGNGNPQKAFADNLAIKSVLPFKADLDASNIATQGQEWVGEWWSTDVWRRARFERIYDRAVAKGMMVQEIPNGHDIGHFPTEGSDPVVYTSPEANTTDSTGRPEVTAKITAIGTGEVTITPKELKLATSYTRILDEDAIVNYGQQLNYQVTEKMLETRDQVIINGDTETAVNTNINIIDGTPATGLETPYYINSNGFRKLPLVTNTAGKVDAEGANTIATYRKTLGLLDGELRQYKERMMYIIDPDTENASLGIPSISTEDVRRTFATIESGILTNIYGIDVATSGFQLLANTAGKVTVATGTTGTILLIYAPYWGVAYRRQIIVDTAFDVLSGSFIVVTSMRMGIIARGNNASVLSFNVGV